MPTLFMKIKGPPKKTPPRKPPVKSSAEEVEVEAPKKAAPKKSAPKKEAPKKAAPVKKQSKKVDKPIVKKSVEKKADKKTSKKAAPKKSIAKKAGAKAATENKVPRVAALKCRALTDDQLEVWSVVHALKVITPANVGERIELRNVDDRAAVLLHEKVGVPCRGCYTQETEVNKVLGYFKKHVPKAIMPAKWLRRVYAEA